MNFQVSELESFMPFQTLGSILKTLLLCQGIAEASTTGGVETGRYVVSNPESGHTFGTCSAKCGRQAQTAICCRLFYLFPAKIILLGISNIYDRL